MPKSVAQKIKDGASAVETCEIFEMVTIVFNDIPIFSDICAQCDGMQIVAMLNNMFGMFDVLSDKNKVYKVETVKDCFVGVAGAPERTKNHAELIMDMAMDMRDCVQFVKDPRPETDGHIKIRLGSHSGQVVGGIVGNKCPRYCLFGDAMNTSSRMMNFMGDWNVVMFLSSPAIKNLEQLTSSGLFICDLSMHDFSRDLLLASSQQSNELKDALDSEVEKTKAMEESMAKLDVEMKRSDELLSQMMPKSVAQKIKDGASAVETCEIFEMVTIVFNDIPIFSDICAQCDGMQIVAMLNNMFGMFDVLSDKNKVYKVETVKDCFVGVAGAPERTKNHAELIMDMAMDMRDCVQFVKDPRPGTDGHIKIRLGSHSGQVVGGIVGNKCPRYCLFGDAMNTSSRMMSFGQEQNIHVSSTVKGLLPAAYTVKERGKVTVKGKGEMVTFWVESKANRIPPTEEDLKAALEALQAKKQKKPREAEEKNPRLR